MDSAKYVPDPLSFQMGLHAMAAMVGGMAPLMTPPLGVNPMAGLMGPHVAGAMASSVFPTPEVVPGFTPAVPPPPQHFPNIPMTVKKKDCSPTAPEDSPWGVRAGAGIDKYKEIDSTLEEQEPQAPAWETLVKDSSLPRMEFSEPPGLEGYDLLSKVSSQASMHTDDIGGRMRRVLWTVYSRKLKGSNKVVVSPSFKLFPWGTFRMMLVPMAANDRKGGGSFKNAKGRGIVQVKCEDELDEESEVRFRISVRGSDKSGPTEDQPRGPVVHKFADSSICSLPREQEEWDFQKDVDSTQAFVVCLEVLFKGETIWPDGIYSPSHEAPGLAAIAEKGEEGSAATAGMGSDVREGVEDLSTALETVKLDPAITQSVL